MARSPFQGTWRDGVRPTVVTAPDAVIYINGQTDLIACTKCRRSFDINKYVTSIQVDLNVNNAPGSANFSLSIPRHSIDDFLVDGEPLLSNMMEVEIYAKGYYLVNGLPQYYPIFWGLITDVGNGYASGQNTFSVSCADILKWWELSRMNTTPALTQAAGQLGANYNTGNVFDGCNVYDVIWTLAQQSMGDVLQAKGSLNSVTREALDEPTFLGLRRDITAYWQARFGKMRSSLLLYGVRGAGVRGDAIYASQPTATSPVGSRFASSAVRNANGGFDGGQLLFDPINDVIPFRSNISNSGRPNHWESEYQTKLELANVCKEAVGFEFYMDVTGDIVFKPPFYNLDTLSNKPVSWVQDIDIIDWDFSESESEVITQLQIQGAFQGGSMNFGVTSDVNTPYTQVTDYHLLRQYGWRPQSFNAEYLENPEAQFYAGLDMLDKINSRRHRGTVNIPLRPELRLGFPVYVAPLDQIWYLSGIGHNIQFGGRAQTTLTLTAKRAKFVAPKGIGTIELTSFTRDAVAKQQKASSTSETSTPLVNSTKPSARELSTTGRFKIKVGLAAETPPTSQQTNAVGTDPYEPLILRHPKTGRIVGYPNVNMAYTRPFDPTSEELTALMGQNRSNLRKAPKIRNRDDRTAAKSNEAMVAGGLVQNEDRNLMDRHLNNRYTYGMTSAGVYTYVHDLSKVIQEIIQLPINNIEVSSGTGTKLDGGLFGSATIRPVSDERGFELVGHFRYGRGVSLRDGALVLSAGGNTRASIDTQLALAGGLFETLTAQSQGLTAAVSSAYGNPADAVARLAPDLEDLQSGATLNPEAREPEFTTAEKSFIDTAPLNSAANRGEVASVEASQLSRALTLAELRVKEDVVPNEECACLLGRADLAFMNVGYQVKILRGTQADNSGSSFDDARRSRVEADRLAKEVLRLQDAIGSKQLERFDVQISSSDGRDALLADLDGQIASLQDELRRTEGAAAGLKTRLEQAASDETATDGTFVGDPYVDGILEGSALPIAGPSAPIAAGLTVTQVEKFLADLYESLDGPHQQYEDALRGKLVEGPSREAIVSGTAVPPTQFSPLSPPFSAGNRARGGDPAALALQGSSAMSDLSQSWKEFGENLQREPKAAALREEVANLETHLRELDAEEERLTTAQQTGSSILSPDGSISSRLRSLENERTKGTRDLDNARAKLRQLESAQ
jgi:hypothetical protein